MATGPSTHVESKPETALLCAPAGRQEQPSHVWYLQAELEQAGL